MSKHTDLILDQLKELWAAAPYMRLGELLVWAVRERKPEADLALIEDSSLVLAVQNYITTVDKDVNE